MATEVNARGAYVKIRHPWGAFFLVLITLGIYYLFWYYFVNRELRDFGGASAESGESRIHVNPWISLLAVTFGWLLIIPPFVSMFRTFSRVRTAQDIADVGPKASPGIRPPLVLHRAHLLPRRGSLRTNQPESSLEGLFEHVNVLAPLLIGADPS